MKTFEEKLNEMLQQSKGNEFEALEWSQYNIKDKSGDTICTVSFKYKAPTPKRKNPKTKI
ncbi:hypothetical protein BU107_11100 [Staphylococcus xylosus]|uniref:hypothetical protein n=1 Tax=Staphylococcus xylosus TaxID=1288 RepID=UPI000E69C3DE|nr:hypothetical protein [Staphylococcus xylosus]RIM85831.1 hypothetical protein BU107_11100 [Staphylococcus xylosus]